LEKGNGKGLTEWNGVRKMDRKEGLKEGMQRDFKEEIGKMDRKEALKRGN
jgi:hypothetical protein